MSGEPVAVNADHHLGDLAARLMARWTSRPGRLIAARRIGDDPRAAFRSVSGLVLALLVTTVATIAITTQDAKDPTRFAIAGCTLAAGIAAGLAERKRPFSLLRLTGARLSTLRGVVALEGAVPLLTVAVVVIGTGFGAAAMYATEAQNRPMVAPGLAYYLLAVGGIIVSLAIIAATFPLLARITGPEAARNE